MMLLQIGHSNSQSSLISAARRGGAMASHISTWHVPHRGRGIDSIDPPDRDESLEVESDMVTSPLKTEPRRFAHLAGLALVKGGC
jgi:hypothetical protein